MAPEDVRYVRGAGVLWRALPTGVLLLGAGQVEPVMVTSPGDVVWALLEAPLATSELTGLLAEHYGADPTVVAADLRDLLDRFVALGVITPAPS